MNSIHPRFRKLQYVTLIQKEWPRREDPTKERLANGFHAGFHTIYKHLLRIIKVEAPYTEKIRTFAHECKSSKSINKLPM